MSSKMSCAQLSLSVITLSALNLPTAVGRCDSRLLRLSAVSTTSPREFSLGLCPGQAARSNPHTSVAMWAYLPFPGSC